MITIDTKSFSDGLKGWAKRFGLSQDVAVRNVASQMFGRIVERTPVDTGWARANWYASLNRRLDTDPGPAPNAPGASFQRADFAGVVAGGKAGDVFMLQNGVPYIEALENGSSQQAAEGMVKLTIAEAGAFFAQYAQGGSK